MLGDVHMGNISMDYTHHYDSILGGITLASDGEALTGYAGGIDRKIKLLQMEGADHRLCQIHSRV